jgi:hypothetical protein
MDERCSAGTSCGARNGGCGVNMRKVLMEIRISPARQAKKHKFIHDIRMEAFREYAIRISENPTLSAPKPSIFRELIYGALTKQ